MNLDRIEAILRLLQRQPHVGEIQAEGETWSLRARKWPGVQPPAGTEAEAPATAEPELPRLVVTAGRVGVFRYGKSPVAAGDRLQAGAAIGAIDSMGIPNPVTVPEAGVVTEVLVEDGEPVEYGQQLLVLTPGEGE